MGTIRNGGNGAFSGKAGSFIGSNWRDINDINGIPRISNKPKTEKQLEQQAKFALAVRFLRPLKLQVEAGFGHYVIGPPSIPRSAQIADIAMPSDWAGKTVHSFVYCRSLEKQDISDSIYAGSAILI